MVLCELEGLSRPEAAKRLGIPEGTLSSRLARAKAQLRDRLARRGMTVPVAVLSTAMLREAQAITLTVSLIEATVQAATTVATGPSAAVAISVSVASLTEGVLKAMLVAKLKGIVLGIGAMTAVVSGAVVLAQIPRTRPGPDDDKLPPTAVSQPPVKDDRTAALEKKLDRILQALERMTGATRDLPPLPQPQPMPQPSAAPPQAPSDPIALQTALAPLSRVEGSGSITDRLKAVEVRLDRLDQFTQSVTGQLQAEMAELRRQVGVSPPPGPSPPPTPTVTHGT